ncbi:MAG: hypothetical protein R2867_12355 [Caldilineaceae bacterium]
MQERYARPDLVVSGGGAGHNHGRRSRGGRPRTAWLFFEDEIGDDLTRQRRGGGPLAAENGIPMAILNACQSGQETARQRRAWAAACCWPGCKRWWPWATGDGGRGDLLYGALLRRSLPAAS